jgi:hypothetical protein
VGGFTPEQLAEKHKLTLDTVRKKIPKLQLEAKREEDRFRAKLEREGMQIVPKPPNGGTQTVQNTVNPVIGGVKTVPNVSSARIRGYRTHLSHCRTPWVQVWF